MSRFMWENFDKEFITSIIYNNKTRKDLIPKRNDPDKDTLIPTMEIIAPYPTSEFIKTYRKEIESLLLKNHPDLIGKIYKDVVGGEMKNYLTMLNKISTMKLGNILMSRYISALSEIGSLGSIGYQGISLYRKPVTIDLKTSHINEITLYDFQKVAIKNLKEKLIISDNASGLLVMPTGERVIIVTGCINALATRVSGTLDKYISCIA